MSALVRDRALRLRIERPEVRNALDAATTDALCAELEQARTRDEIRVVLLEGAGGAFSSGADLTGPDGAAGFDVTTMDRANRLIRAVVSLDRPVVAVVDGPAAGVGCSLALACDLVVASTRASFLLPFTRIGLMPDGGAVATLAASIGRARTMRMALLAEPLSAEDAFGTGLVSHLTDPDQLPGTVADLLARLAAGPPLALAATKRAVNTAALQSLEPALESERVGQTVLLRTADAAEGIAAFAEKRAARFTGE